MYKQCQHTTKYWKKIREQWECKQCTYRTPLKSDTVMNKTQVIMGLRDDTYFLTNEVEIDQDLKLNFYIVTPNKSPQHY